MENITDRIQLNDLLEKNKIRIINYIKQDGTSRDVYCTLDFDVIPKEKHPQGNERKKTTPDYLLNIFDLEKNDWRSLVIRKIKKCKIGNDIYTINIKG